MALSSEAIAAMLSALEVPQTGKRLADLARIEGITIHEDTPEGASVRVALGVDPGNGSILESLRLAAEEHLKAQPGIAMASVMLTSQRKGEPQRPPQAAPPNQSAGIIELPRIRHIVAVASGKGGVGKSTVAANLAAALAASGWRTGLMDADIHGPSVPTLVGYHGKPELTPERKLKPVEAHGLKTMSVGYLTEPEQALIWRGPMVQNALIQMLRDVDWGDLDILILDLPPGTGDIQLSLAQKLRMKGAVIVSTPQDLALADARRAITMFDKVSVSVLGIVENMSVFTCPHCGGESHIFGHDGAKAEAERRALPFLGAVPLTMSLRETSDLGVPVVSAKPEDPASLAFMALAEALRATLDGNAQPQRAQPKIVWQ